LKFGDKDVKRGLNFFKTSLSKSVQELSDLRFEVYSSVFGVFKNGSTFEKILGYGVGDVQKVLSQDYQSMYDLLKNKNLLHFTESFDHQFWFKNNITIKPNEGGSQVVSNADLLYSDINDEPSSKNISIKVPSFIEGPVTLSVFGKKSTSNFLVLRNGNMSQRAVFDLENGVILKQHNVLDSKIERHKQNWFRCAITTIPDQNGLVLFGLSNENAEYVYHSELSQGIFLYGAQLEKGKMSSYIKSENDNYNLLIKQDLNTHNNYFFFLLSIGVLGLLFFIVSLFELFVHSIEAFNFEKLLFLGIIAVNCLTENIFERQWGLMFFVLGILLFYMPSNNKQQISE
jgi:hypothetical protein